MGLPRPLTGLPWVSMDFYGYPMGLPLASMDLPWVFMVSGGFP